MSEQSRIPPQAVEVEQNLLGGMMLESEAVDIALSMLTAEDFYKPGHQDIMRVIQDLYKDGESIDLLTITESLRKAGKLDTVDESYLIDLTNHSASAANADYLCQIILEKSVRRTLIQQCNQIIQKSYDQSTDTNDVVDQAQAAMFSVTEDRQGSMRTITEVLKRVMSDIQEIQQNGQPIGLRTGLDLDDVLQGFQKSKLYVLGARPSMGKTALAMTILRRLSRNGHDAGILSLETSDKALGIRLLTQVSSVAADTISSGNMSGPEMQSVLDAANKLSEYGILIDDEPALSAQKVRSKCRLMVKRGVEIIFIDFLTLIKGDGRTKHEEVGEITKVLKQVSKELDIPIVVLAQLSRKVEDRSDKRPQMSDLRESGSIEEDSDCIMFLYRPEYYGITTTPAGDSTDGLADVIIAKNKDGKTGTKTLRFIDEYMRFENFDYHHRDIKPPSQPPQPHYLDDIDEDPGF